MYISVHACILKSQRASSRTCTRGLYANFGKSISRRMRGRQRVWISLGARARSCINNNHVAYIHACREEEERYTSVEGKKKDEKRQRARLPRSNVTVPIGGMSRQSPRVHVCVCVYAAKLNIRERITSRRALVRMQMLIARGSIGPRSRYVCVYTHGALAYIYIRAART